MDGLVNDNPVKLTLTIYRTCQWGIIYISRIWDRYPLINYSTVCLRKHFSYHKVDMMPTLWSLVTTGQRNLSSWQTPEPLATTNLASWTGHWASVIGKSKGVLTKNHIDTETKWSSFSRRHFQVQFQPNDCLINRLFGRRSKKTSKLRVTGLCAGNSPAVGEFPAQMASKAEKFSIWWRHHGARYGLSILRSFDQRSIRIIM